MRAYLRSQWFRLFPEGPARVTGEVLDRLFKGYTEKHRHYHTLDHLFACFRLLQRLFPDASQDVRFALWFHDIVYDTHGSDNEERSGEIAIEEMGLMGLDGLRVYELIMATKHDAVPEDEEARILVDVDLSILGETDDVYSRYEQQVRREYEWVPEEVFWARRRTILKGLMDQKRWGRWALMSRESVPKPTRNFYLTDPMRRSEYESRAWKNLAGSVAS